MAAYFWFIVAAVLVFLYYQKRKEVEKKDRTIKGLVEAGRIELQKRPHLTEQSPELADLSEANKNMVVRMASASGVQTACNVIFLVHFYDHIARYGKIDDTTVYLLQKIAKGVEEEDDDNGE